MIIPNFELHVADGIPAKAHAVGSGVEYGEDVTAVLSKLSIASEVEVNLLLDTSNPPRPAEDSKTRAGAVRGVLQPLLAKWSFRVSCGADVAVDATDILEILNLSASHVVLPSNFPPGEISKLPQGRFVIDLGPMSEAAAAAGKLTDSLVAGESCAFQFSLPKLPASITDEDISTVKTIVAAIDEATSGAKFNSLSCKTTGASRETVAALSRCGVDVVCPVTVDGHPLLGVKALGDELELSDGIIAPLTSDRPDGLYATVVVDEVGVALGLVYSNDESVKESVKTGRGVYHSRKRGLWYKGESSGATQDLIQINLDCDSDALQMVVRQHGAGFCHLERRSCWGNDKGFGHLMRTLHDRRQNAPAGSYTKRLFDDSALLRSKLLEEADELLEADNFDEVAWEAADVMYFSFVRAALFGVDLRDIQRQLDRRSLKVYRRPGNAKPERVAKGL